MSSINLHRRVIATPLSNSSPGLVYFSPTKIPCASTKNSNYLQVNKSNFHLCTKSAERFKKREKLQKRRFFHHSPHTPKYIRYKSVQRRLNFDNISESDDVKQFISHKNSSKLNHPKKHSSNIPSIEITTTNTSNCLEQIHVENKLRYLDDQNIIRDVFSPNLKILISNSIPFQKHQLLGRGRYGTVIRSEYNGEKVAVKFIVMCKNSNCILSNERNGLGLKHVNIVNVELIAWSSDPHLGLIIMKCYDNARNLQIILDDETFLMNLQRILRFSYGICNGVRYLHTMKILHLDIKPKNILILPGDICKLCDFGSSIKYDKVDNVISEFPGTIYYCAPEIWKEKRASTASDVYSIGITFWQIIHRTMPYDFNKREEYLMYQIVKNNLRPLIKPSLSSSIFLKNYKNIYVACWHPNVSNRPSIEFILGQLNHIECTI